jgi:hypothetical protein
MGKSRRIVHFILAFGLAVVGAMGAIYVLFFAAGGYFLTAVASAIFLGIGLIWLPDFVDVPSPQEAMRRATKIVPCPALTSPGLDAARH